MKHLFSLLIIGIAGFKLTISFMHSDAAVTLFGVEINNWAYRAIWLGAALLSVYSLVRKKNEKEH
jgi:uncharacterized YccA/Bax inhibitor family protein